jgi:hypothetical protein
MNRSERSYKEKSYPTPSITSQDEESQETMMRISKVMRTMSWMTMRMTMREVSIWVMRRRLDLSRRKPRLVRVIMSEILCRQIPYYTTKGTCIMLVRLSERRRCAVD